jgi:hypothetical protein
VILASVFKRFLGIASIELVRFRAFAVVCRLLQNDAYKSTISQSSPESQNLSLAVQNGPLGVKRGAR